MFTGLVQARATVVEVEHSQAGSEITLEGAGLDDLSNGDSIAVSGVCLTAAIVDGRRVRFTVMPETGRRSSLGSLRTGDEVNIELALLPSDRLAGHIVQGHVDGLGELVAATDEGSARLLRIAADHSLVRYLVAKGSIAVDGVSLTIVDVVDESFTVSLIPETCRRTTLGQAQLGQMVNLEIDVIAKYVERLVGPR